MIPYIPLMMRHESLATAPDIPLPHGYSLEPYRPGDEESWALIAVSAGEFDSLGSALEYFIDHFRDDFSQLESRCLFLLDETGNRVGTATGWFMDSDRTIGRLHWVVIEKEHQGRGLCKPLVAAAMRRMLRLGHERALLTTQPESWKGIKVYLDLGWSPYDDGAKGCKTGWALVRELTGREINPQPQPF